MICLAAIVCGRLALICVFWNPKQGFTPVPGAYRTPGASHITSGARIRATGPAGRGDGAAPMNGNAVCLLNQSFIFSLCDWVTSLSLPATG
jgi:hypothetical protein